MEQQNSYWRQRAKEFWLQDRDNNTKYFHNDVKRRRRNNIITRLKDSVGNWVTEQKDLEALVTQHYLNLFESKRGNMNVVLNCIPHSITQEQNRLLMRKVNKEEVRLALFSMNPDKSPGPDGMSSGIYQHFWDIIGSDIVAFCDHVVSEGALPKNVNKTQVVLIPKRSKPENLSELRPISLCNVLYKLVSKVLANRLKPLLGCLVSEAQSVFIPGRFITDNIMIAFEMQHYQKRKNQGKVGYGALKLDMSKAHDRLEWFFLKEIMKRMGFGRDWIELIWNCISTVEFYFLLNNSEIGPVIPGRGIRQGDPLSPYLFIIAFEGLSAIIHKQQQEGGIHGITVARGAPTISHLLFADDSFMFSKLMRKRVI